MGGFVTRAAYKQGAPIKRTAYIASPHFGNPISYFEINPEIRNIGFFNFYEKLAITEELKHLIGGATEFEKKWKDLYSKWPSAYELMPDDFYLNTRPMIYSDGQPILGANETYMKNGWSLPQNMQDNVKKAMEFKKSLGEKIPGNEDDILVIYGNTLETLDTIGYSSTGITIDENTSFHFSPPFDFNQHGDSLVVTESAMGSMSGSPTYKNSKPISNIIHTALPNDKNSIYAIEEFLTTGSSSPITIPSIRDEDNIKDATSLINTTLQIVRETGHKAAKIKGHEITPEHMQMIEQNTNDALHAKEEEIKKNIEKKGVDLQKISKAVDELFFASISQAEKEGRSHITPGDVTLAFLELGIKGCIFPFCG